MSNTWDDFLNNAKKLKEQSFEESRKLYEAEEKRYEDMIKTMMKPKDISKMSLQEQAGYITLSFIGYVGRPTGISKELLEKCAKAFDSNRDKVEREEAAVLKVLEERSCQKK